MNARWLRGAIWAAVLLLAPCVGFAISCTAEKLPVKGQLMLVLSTNLAPPSDFDALKIQIIEEGTNATVHEVEYSLDGAQAIKLPATLGVVAGSDPNRAVRITVEARRRGTLRVKRVAIARAPRGRVAALPLSVDGLCLEKTECGDVDGTTGTCIAGTCHTAAVDTDSLPDYSAASVFGGGTGNGDGECFDTLACFTNGKTAEVDRGNCSVPLDTQSGFGVNIAVVSPPSVGGICASNACLIPLDRDPLTGPIFTGWREEGGRARLPIAVCEGAYPVMVTTACKTKAAPTCGPWSATGKGRELSDASLPFDAAAFPGDGGPAPGFGVVFLDEDPAQGAVSGTVTVERAPDERNIAGYNLYWADGPAKKLDLITKLKKTGANVTHTLKGPMLPGATHLIAVSEATDGTERDTVSVGPIDNYPRTTHISTGNVDFPIATPLVDAQTNSLLIVGYDRAVGKPALLRCKLDGSDCQYKDISSGEVGILGAVMSSAVIDPVNRKLLVFLEQNPSQTKSRLHRCELDGTGCTTVDIGLGFFQACRVPMVVDAVNKKLLILIDEPNSNILHCDLDGQNCVNRVMPRPWGTCRAAVISPTDSRLLVVQGANPTQLPVLLRCQLDGTSCTQEDISAGKQDVLGDVSAALDTANQKLIVVTAKTNGPTLYHYRCNLNGSGCVARDLGVIDPGLGAPVKPSLVVDPARRALFSFSYAGAPIYTRCELDGTGCKNTVLTPVGPGNGGDPAAILHDGKLISVSNAFPTLGIDLTIVSSY